MGTRRRCPALSPDLPHASSGRRVLHIVLPLLCEQETLSGFLFSPSFKPQPVPVSRVFASLVNKSILLSISECCLSVTSRSCPFSVCPTRCSSQGPRYHPGRHPYGRQEERFQGHLLSRTRFHLLGLFLCDKRPLPSSGPLPDHRCQRVTILELCNSRHLNRDVCCDLGLPQSSAVGHREVLLMQCQQLCSLDSVGELPISNLLLFRRLLVSLSLYFIDCPTSPKSDMMKTLYLYKWDRHVVCLKLDDEG